MNDLLKIMKYNPKLKDNFTSQKCSTLYRVVLLALIMFVLHLCLKPQTIEVDIVRDETSQQINEETVKTSIAEVNEKSNEIAQEYAVVEYYKEENEFETTVESTTPAQSNVDLK